MLKYTFIFLLLFLMLSSSVFAQPFAPVAPVPENASNDPDLALGIAFIKDVKVPDKSEVGIPAYPGAQIIQTNKGQEGTLPSVRLVSADDMKLVIDYYKKELKDWNSEDIYSIYMFWNGENKMKAMMGGEPVVQIEDGSKFANLVPGTKSTILVGYKNK
jgi:hypothetical protein